MFIRFTFQSVPVILASLVLWIVIGGAYQALAPENAAGIDNIGILLSVFGISLFLCDRFASVRLKAHSWVIIMKTWLWGLIFIAWGFYEWTRVLSKTDLLWYLIHWSVLLAVIIFTYKWESNYRHQTVSTEKQNIS